MRFGHRLHGTWCAYGASSCADALVGASAGHVTGVEVKSSHTWGQGGLNCSCGFASSLTEGRGRLQDAQPHSALL